jgi:hypothetical protein
MKRKSFKTKKPEQNLPPKVRRALKWITTILRKQEIPYQICGGLCARFYGATRRINDIDIDIREKDFSRLQTIIKPYLISGPNLYVDKKWRVLMMSLKYKKQLIEFTNGDIAKISNSDRSKWLVFRYDLCDVEVILWEDTLLNLMKAKKILRYKKYLDGKKQKEDIEAIKNYILFNKNPY